MAVRASTVYASAKLVNYWILAKRVDITNVTYYVSTVCLCATNKCALVLIYMPLIKHTEKCVAFLEVPSQELWTDWNYGALSSPNWLSGDNEGNDDFPSVISASLLATHGPRRVLLTPWVALRAALHTGNGRRTQTNALQTSTYFTQSFPHSTAHLQTQWLRRRSYRCQLIGMGLIGWRGAGTQEGVTHKT